MSSESQHQNQVHAGTCVGHCRAQRFALDYAPHCDLIRPTPYYCTEQYEKDKAALTSYEEGWVQTFNSEAQAKLEDDYEGCCNTPPEQSNILATSFLTESETSRTRPAPSVSASKAPSLWRSTSNLQCQTCGGHANL